MARKDNKKPWLLFLGLGIGAAILGRSKGAKAASMGKRYKAPMKLTENFDLSEFLSGHKGLMAYELDQDQFENVSRLAALLQKGRDLYGPITVTSGGRPKDWRAPPGTFETVGDKKTDVSGKSLAEILKLKGYSPAENTDHAFFGAADLDFDAPDKAGKAAMFFAQQPETRQVILEYKRVKEPGAQSSKLVPNTLHVAVVMPGKPKIKGDAYAFVQVDGAREGTLNWQQPIPVPNV